MNERKPGHPTTKDVPARVLIANPNVLSSGLLSQALGQDSNLHVIACTGDAEGLHRAMKMQCPDVLLLSIHVQELVAERFKGLKLLLEEFPKLACVVLLNANEREVVIDALRAGAKGLFVCSEPDLGALKKCVQRVLEGQIWLDTTQMHFLLSAVSSRQQRNGHGHEEELRKLTERERQVVRWVAEGLGNHDIAAAMNLRDNTIKNYIFRIYEKLGVSNRVELALYAAKNLPADEGNGPRSQSAGQPAHKRERRGVRTDSLSVANAVA